MIKKNKLTSAILTSMIGSLILAACSQSVATEWKSNIKVILKVDDNFNDSEVPNFLNAWTTEAEKLRVADPNLRNLPSFKINLFSKVSDYKVISDDISVNKADIGFVNSAVAYQNQKNYHVSIQALTDAFNADPEISQYDSATNGKNLLEIGEKLSKQFNQTAYQSWDDTKQAWTGNRYDFLYRLNDQSLSSPTKAKSQQAEQAPQEKPTYTYKKVIFYRGMILMWGDTNKIAEIKKAWNDKDWSTFRSFGMITGGGSSIGKYLLQQNLLKEHFNKEGKAFGVSLAAEKLKAPNSFIEGSGQDIGQSTLANYHLAFDDEASYAWTHNRDKDSKVITSYFNPGENKKIEVLTVTNPNLYDAGIFSKTVDVRQVKLISEALINLANTGKDKYGPDVGYNGYKLIENLNSEFNSFMKWMN